MAAQPIKASVWNVHGLNAPTRCNAVCQVVRVASPAILCVPETKVQVVTDPLVKQCFGNRLEKYYYLPAVGTRGGIILAWDATLVSLSCPHDTMNTVTTLVQSEGVPHWWSLWPTGGCG